MPRVPHLLKISQWLDRSSHNDQYHRADDKLRVSARPSGTALLKREGKRSGYGHKENVV
jgi:hypothetical protein